MCACIVVQASGLQPSQETARHIACRQDAWTWSLMQAGCLDLECRQDACTTSPIRMSLWNIYDFVS